MIHGVDASELHSLFLGRYLQVRLPPHQVHRRADGCDRYASCDRVHPGRESFDGGLESMMQLCDRQVCRPFEQPDQRHEDGCLPRLESSDDFRRVHDFPPGPGAGPLCGYDILHRGFRAMQAPEARAA